ncbi:transglycosylase SLT domain-containing protein [Aromatoleum diolicum]|uniref:Transglycosylase SLT domain-containing protein n=1 Tax=Aromatoleum diolicum TaxID=75796 RepID=A0ABX1QEE6_9RHOO|nr:transglycosylase SLT domain-containing protein [Aromatoleum diolicum]NMG76303.1 transglycosylase SLT domain-containing protein [Aromatoleum diolicum]
MKQRCRANRRFRLLAPWLLAAGVAVSTAAIAKRDGPESFPDRAVAGRARYLLEQAVAHEHGEGVGRDPVKAAALYCEAARLGDAEAMHSLGWMYANGRGLPRSDAYAGTLFAMAAFLGHAQAERMRRFTGDYVGDVPDCLQPPSEQQLEAGWSAESHIQALAAPRQSIARTVVKLARDYAISPRLALAIALTESGLNPVAVSPKNAMGVMQLIPATAARFNVRNPFDPVDNIKGGLAYLRWLLAYFRGDIALAAAGYNAGEGAVDRYRGVPPYPETKAYVARILAFVKRRQHPYDSSITEPSTVLPGLELVSQREVDS